MYIYIIYIYIAYDEYVAFCIITKVLDNSFQKLKHHTSLIWK